MKLTKLIPTDLNTMISELAIKIVATEKGKIPNQIRKEIIDLENDSDKNVKTVYDSIVNAIIEH